MNLQRLKLYGMVAFVIVGLMFLSFLVGQWKRNNQGETLSGPVATQEYTPDKPLKVHDKAALKGKKIIPKAVVEDSKFQVTATGTKEDETGTTHFSSVLDAGTGQSVIVQQRPIAEFLSSNAVGVGAGINREGFYKTVYYRRDLARVFDFYLSAGAEMSWTDSGHEWTAGVKAEYRF